jgi:metal-responsive CopG/Arc/MetJ family transcriptional regulator
MALASLESERKIIENFKGTVFAVIAVTHSTGSDTKVAGLRHEFDHIIKTQIHNTLQNGCIELFFVEGSADDVRSMFSVFRADPRVRNAKILAF